MMSSAPLDAARVCHCALFFFSPAGPQSQLDYAMHKRASHHSTAAGSRDGHEEVRCPKSRALEEPALRLASLRPTPVFGAA